jgi:hypothetical protein
MKRSFVFLLLMAGCATSPQHHTVAQDALVGRGPWSQVPTVEMPTGDTTLPISLLRDVADALLELPGAKVCDAVTRRPIVGLSTEYCSTFYVAGTRDSLSWRVTEPIKGNHEACTPFFVVKDADYPARIILRYFPTGEIQQWSTTKADWVTLGTCAPSATTSRDRKPRCNQPLRLLRE